MEGRSASAGTSVADTKLTVTRFYAGLGDDRVARGQAWHVRTELGGNVIRYTENDVGTITVGSYTDPLLRRAVVHETRSRHYEGVSTPIETWIHYEYDIYGRRVKETNHGRLDMTGDEYVKQQVYAPDVSDDQPWVRDRVTDEYLKEINSTLVSHQRFYFGDDTTVTPVYTSVGKGWPVMTQGWLAEELRWVTLSTTKYDVLGNPIESYGEGITRTLTYDSLGLFPESETVSPEFGLDLTWQMSWDTVFGQPLTRTDPNADVTMVAYDSLGRLSSVAQNGPVPHTRYAYDWTLDAVGDTPKTYTYVFDGAESTLAGLADAWLGGAPWRESVSVVNGGGEALYAATKLNSSRWIVSGWAERDHRGRTIYVADNSYTDDGSLPTTRPTSAVGQTIRYDGLDRAVEQVLPTGARKALSYAAFAQTVDADDLAPVSSTLDGLGRILRTQRVVETGTEFVDATYDAAGHIKAMSLPQSVQHTFNYDTLGRLVTANDPDIGPRDLSYNDQGWLIEHQNGIPQSVMFTYDEIGRLVTRSSDGATFTYHYDVQKDLGTGDRVLGRLGWVDEPDGHVELAYDQFGRAVTTRRTIKTLSAAETTTLSPSGLVLASSHANSDFSATVSYDAAGRATQVNSGLGMLWQATGIDAAGRIMQEQFGNGVTQTTARDVLGQPSEVNIYRPGEPVPGGTRYYGVTLDRNAWGAVTRVTDNSGVGLDHNATFAYDSAARLTGATMGVGGSPGGYGFGYTYDSLQNMITRTQPVNATSLGTLLGTYRYGEAGAGPRQLTSVLKPDATVHNFVYDAAGRVTDDGGTLLTYNGLDQLISAQIPGEVYPVEHGYGYNGLRTFTKDPAGNEQYWFTPNLRQHDGLREHYIKLGSRIIAKVTQADIVTPPADAGVADARVTVWRGGGGRTTRPVAAALLALCLLFAAVAIARRRARFPRWMRAVASVCIAAMFSMLIPACTWIGSNERPVWQHQKTTYFHYGFGAGPTLTTREDSTVVEERRYEPFGQPMDAYREVGGVGELGLVDHVAEPTNSLNKETDPSTGWSYHGARWMAPQTGRWLTPDPPVKGPDPKFMGEPWAIHPYQYVNQNPVAYWDPGGQDKKSLARTVWENVGGFGGGAALGSVPPIVKRHTLRLEHDSNFRFHNSVTWQKMSRTPELTNNARLEVTMSNLSYRSGQFVAILGAAVGALNSWMRIKLTQLRFRLAVRAPGPPRWGRKGRR